MGTKKIYNKAKKQCKVTFSLPKDATKTARKVHLVGDFNNWSIKETPLKKAKTGEFSVTINLNGGKDYQYRYLLDQTKWENDWAADKYAPSPLDQRVENSVVQV